MVGRLDIWLFDPLDARSDYFALWDAARSIFCGLDAWSLVASTLALMLLLAWMLLASIMLLVQMLACLIIWLFGPFDARLDYFARWDAAQWDDVACSRHLVVWMLGCWVALTAALMLLLESTPLTSLSDDADREMFARLDAWPIKDLDPLS